MNFDPLAATDFYKIGHIKQYPVGTEMIYSNLTARSNRHARTVSGVASPTVVWFGLQYVVRELLIRGWGQGFFSHNINSVVERYERRIRHTLGEDQVDSTHIRALHKLGYLPIRIKALPEGTRVPTGCPMMTIVNTHPDFFWLTNFLETSLSSMLWKPVTSATTASQYRNIFEYWARQTGAEPGFVDFQGHDFSFRGLSNVQDAALSGAAHLTSFKGTDSIPAIDLLEDYYGADITKELVGASVPATEHSVMCAAGQVNELDTMGRLITQVYPKGIVSIVSDSWDFWGVLTEFLPKLKENIMARDGKVVIRPDSGDPVKIICGDDMAPVDSPERKGAVQCLWEVFGGKKNQEGYMQLDPHIGLIYGDSISLQRAEDILCGLSERGFASDNVVLGIGSYTYQYVTRDNYGFAIKSTAARVNGQLREIFKDPKTDDGTKKSAKGLLRVDITEEGIEWHDQQTEEQEAGGALQTVFEDGELNSSTTLGEIRQRVGS